MGISGSEIIFILIFVLIFFGADKIPGFAKTLGKGMREFKKAADDIKREITSETGDLTKDFRDIRNNITSTVNSSEMAKDLHEIRQDFQNTVSSSGIAQEVNGITQDLHTTVNDTPVAQDLHETKQDVQNTVNDNNPLN